MFNQDEYNPARHKNDAPSNLIEDLLMLFALLFITGLILLGAVWILNHYTTLTSLISYFSIIIMSIWLIFQLDQKYQINKEN